MYIPLSETGIILIPFSLSALALGLTASEYTEYTLRNVIVFLENLMEIFFFVALIFLHCTVIYSVYMIEH